jgi:hypothetical protein
MKGSKETPKLETFNEFRGRVACLVVARRVDFARLDRSAFAKAIVSQETNMQPVESRDIACIRKSAIDIRKFLLAGA